MRELEVTEDPPQKNMAIMGIPIATMPPVPVPKRACAEHLRMSRASSLSYALALVWAGRGSGKSKAFSRRLLACNQDC